MSNYHAATGFRIFFTVILLAAAGCSATQRPPVDSVSFAVMGNTSPASPFTGYPEKLEQVFQSINRDNPMFVIHTGNIIQGGAGNVGIRPGDITRQHLKFIEQKKALRPILHILAGERDLFDGSLDLFRQYTGGRLWYSFNYGTVHFIMLHVLNGAHGMAADQLKWLKRDLAAHRYDSAVFVFTHYPVLSSPYGGARYRDGALLHELFVKYPVKAVFSGSLKGLYEFEKDGIRYITAGCSGYNAEDRGWSFNQYYIVQCKGEKFTLRAARVNAPSGAYRP